MVPKDLKYTLNHEWVRLKGKTAIIGLTGFALEGLGKVLSVELPRKGDELLVGIAFGDVETTEALHEIVSPVEGEVMEINKAIFRNLDVLTKDPYKRGWLIKVRLSTPQRLDSLLSPEDYQSQVRGKVRKG